MVMVRIWNPSRFAFDQLPEPTPEERAAAATQELSPRNQHETGTS